MKSLTILALVVAWCGLVWLIATDDAFGQDPFTIGPEVGTQSGLYESYDEAAAYWAAVPGTPTIIEACGVAPQIFLVDTGTANGWGIAKYKDDPCKIWAEAKFMTETDALPGWWRDQNRCRLVVHEYGHALGLDHKDYGDSVQVMLDKRIPAQCVASYPPPVPAKDMPALRWSPTLCVPAWAYYGPEKVLNSYLVGRTQKARTMFKRWSKRHRRDARKYAGMAAVCLDREGT